MTGADASGYDPDLLELPPSAGWTRPLLLCGLVAALGFGLALLTVIYPPAGMGAVAGVALLLLLVRTPALILWAFGIALGIPIQLSPEHIPINAADALLVLWWICVPLILLRQGPHAWRIPVPVKAIIPFTFAVLMSVVLASEPPGQIKQFLRIVEWFIAMPLAFCIFRATPRFMRIAAMLLMVMPCIFAIDGIVEFFNHGNSISRMIGIPVPAPEDTSPETIHHTFDVSGRAGSTFGGAQGLAIFIVMLIGVPVVHLIRSPSRGLRLLAAACLAICVAGLAVAESRGGMMGALAVVLVIAVLERPRLGRLLMVSGAVAIAGALLIVAMWPGWDGTIASLVPGGRPDAVIDRLTIWRTAFDVWRDNPLFGVGLGNFRDHAMQRQIDLLVPLGYESFHAHNTYIEIMVDTGLFGLSCYLFFLGTVGRTLLRRWRSLRIDQRFPHALIFTQAAVGTLVAYMVFAAVDMLLLENTHMLVMLVFCLGLMDLERPRPATQGIPP